MLPYHREKRGRIVGHIIEEPRKETFLWKIENFLHLPQNIDTLLESPKFLSAGYAYYLELYPNGERKHHSRGWLGLYARQCSCATVSSTIDAGILNTISGEIEFKKKASSTAIRKFLLRLDVFDRRYKYLPGDTLTIWIRFKHEVPLKRPCLNSGDHSGAGIQKDRSERGETSKNPADQGDDSDATLLYPLIIDVEEDDSESEKSGEEREKKQQNELRLKLSQGIVSQTKLKLQGSKISSKKEKTPAKNSSVALASVQAKTSPRKSKEKDKLSRTLKNEQFLLIQQLHTETDGTVKQMGKHRQNEQNLKLNQRNLSKSLIQDNKTSPKKEKTPAKNGTASQVKTSPRKSKKKDEISKEISKNSANEDDDSDSDDLSFLNDDDEDDSESEEEKEKHQHKEQSLERNQKIVSKMTKLHVHGSKMYSMIIENTLAKSDSAPLVHAETSPKKSETTDEISTETSKNPVDEDDDTSFVYPLIGHYPLNNDNKGNDRENEEENEKHLPKEQSLKVRKRSIPQTKSQVQVNKTSSKKEKTPAKNDTAPLASAQAKISPRKSMTADEISRVKRLRLNSEDNSCEGVQKDSAEHGAKRPRLNSGDHSGEGVQQDSSEHGGLTLLSSHFRQLFLEEEYSDVTIDVKGKTIKAHKVVLKARSKGLFSMLENSGAEDRKAVIKIEDCEPDAFEIFLLYLYTGKVEKLSPTNMLNLYEIAVKFDAPDMKAECVKYIKHSMTMENLCSVTHVARKHKDTKLLKCATDYFLENVNTTMEIVVKKR